MATHSSTLAWKIPWTEEPGRLQSMGSRRVGHDWATSLSLFTFMLWRRKWQPTPVFLPGEPQRRQSLVDCRLWGRTESDTTEATWQQQQMMLVVKNLSANAGDMVSIPGSGRSPGGGHGNPLQYSCLESPMDRGARQSESQSQLKWQHAHREWPWIYLIISVMRLLISPFSYMMKP